MKDEYKQTLITYRLDRSKESLKAAQLLLENNMLTSAMNRIYYIIQCFILFKPFSC